MTNQENMLASIRQALTLLTTVRRSTAESYFDAIDQELRRLNSLAKKQWPLSNEMVQTLWLGPFAVRNLEEVYPELAALLEKIHYLCKAHLDRSI